MTPKRRIVPIFIPHEGCEHECVFCNQHAITKSSGYNDATLQDNIKHYDLQNINEIISTSYRNNDDNPAEIAFYGGSFTALPEARQIELLEATQTFISSGNFRSIRVSTRPDCIDEKTLVRLKRYGVETMELGVQSMCDDVLSLSNRGHTAYDTIRAARLIKSYGLSLILQFMTGLPGDSMFKSVYTAKQIAKLVPNGIRIYPTVVISGTRLHELWMRGQYMEHTIDDAVDLCARILPIFERAEIPVIRLGLNPTEALGAESVVAGAYHPAFGELVYSRLYYQKARNLLKNSNHGHDVVLTVKKGHTSMMVGQKRKNIVALKDEFNLRSIKIVESQHLTESNMNIMINK